MGEDCVATARADGGGDSDCGGGREMSGGESVGGSRRGVSLPGDAGSPGAVGHRQERL